MRDDTNQPSDQSLQAIDHLLDCEQQNWTGRMVVSFQDGTPTDVRLTANNQMEGGGVAMCQDESIYRLTAGG